jgi:predicted amidophosphoribosyltransferase
MRSGADMDADNVEIECPVCDQKIRADAPRCPNCGAEFVMSGVDELEKVARDLDRHAAPEYQRPVPAPVTGSAPAAETAKAEDPGEKGFLGKLFRKRK